MNPKQAIPRSRGLDRITGTQAFSADEPLIAVIEAEIQERAARQGLSDTSVKAQLLTLSVAHGIPRPVFPYLT